MPEELLIAGKPLPLRGAHQKVTGAERYAPDRSLAGALWMKILRSPHSHARIKKIDVSAAEALPGVRAVLTYKDVPPNELVCTIFNFKGKILDKRARFVGDEIAAVAAVTERIAEEALDLIKVDYEVLPAVFDMEQALKRGAPDVSGSGTNKVSTPPDPGIFESYQEWGDVEKGFKEADATVELEVRNRSIYGSFFPPACIADWTGDNLTLVISHQGPFGIRTAMCRAMGIPENKVRVIAPVVSGQFGMLNSCHRFYEIAALLSKKAGRPVVYKMTLEEFGVYKRRPMDVMRMKLAGKKDGTITALDLEQIHDNGGYGYKSTSYGTMHDIFPRSNVKYAGYGANINLITSGCIRGVGDVPQALTYSLAVNYLAEELGLDPIIIWQKNHAKVGDPRRCDGRPGLTLSSEAFDELIDKGAKAIDWHKKFQGAGKPYEVNGHKKRGVGISVGLHVSGVPTSTAASTVKINRDGTAQVEIGFMEIGTGSRTTLAQLCAEVLGFKFDDVYVVKEVDTDTGPYAPMTGASRTMHIGGSAVKVASLDARRQILELAFTAPWSPDSLKKGLKSPDDLDIKEGLVYVKSDPSRCVAVKDIVGPPGPAPVPQVIGRATRQDIPLSGPTAYTTMVSFADVEVDTETGKVTVLKLVNELDAGRIMNPEICENQSYGGALQSIGYALMEQIAFDPATGKVLNPALADYWIPTAMDVPPIEVIFADNLDPVGPLGVKGIGESTAICPHGAIAVAVYNATGVKINKLPITPDVILTALGR